MKLRGQLLLVALLVIALPVSGLWFVRQTQQLLASGHEQAQLDTLAALATTLGTDSWPEPEGPALYVHDVPRAIILDGHADDWRPWMDQSLSFGGGDHRVEFLGARHGRGTWFLFLVRDRRLVLNDPLAGPGDRIRLGFGAGDRTGEIELAPLAPGFIEARGQPQDWPRLQAWLQPRTDGWTLELYLPPGNAPDRLGFVISHVDDPVSRRVAAQSGTIRDAHPAPELMRLVARDRDIEQRLTQLTPLGVRVWATDAEGWVLAEADRRGDQANRGPASESAEVSWWRTLLFERVLRGRLREAELRPRQLGRLHGPEIDSALDGVPGFDWHGLKDRPGVQLSVALPVENDRQLKGALVMERDADALLLLTNRAVAQLAGTSLVALTVIALGLFGYAAWLSERIRRLRNAAETAVADDGRVVSSVPASTTTDEVGDLGRSLAELLARLQAQQDYLRTLADRLAHELRTPLAAIRSSLDNLEASRDPGQVAAYSQRAREGSERLNRIFQAMSQAARIEDSLADEPLTELDLNEFVRAYFDTISQVYENRQLVLEAPDHAVRVRASADLLAQLLDKLIDNAVDFSPVGGRIELKLTVAGDQARLSVENAGSRLPADTRTLFNSMVSLRDRRDQRPHLGMGLYVARLIAAHHHAALSADNGKLGARFNLSLPLAPAPAS